MRYLVFITFICGAVILPAQSLAATDIASRMSGRILLDVHRHGEAWYVDPIAGERVYLGRPTDAFAVMRTYGLGITNSDLARLPVAPGSDTRLAERLAGRIVLAVESHGEAWYIHPVTLTRVSLGTPGDAWNIMRGLGLGIHSQDLVNIPVANDIDVHHDVDFFAQAPLGEWNDPRQQDGCEEASVLMAVAHARGQSMALTEARDAIVAMSNWELEQFGYYIDTSAEDTYSRLLTTYLEYADASFTAGITVDDIRDALTAGDLVVVTAAGTVLANPNYVGGGPLRHTVLAVGYEAATDTFLIHDPGTQNGAFTRVGAAHLQESLMDYASGNHVPVGNYPDAMITISLP